MRLDQIVVQLAGSVASYTAGVICGIIITALMAATSLTVLGAVVLGGVMVAGSTAGIEAAKAKIREADLPLWTRKLVTEKRVMKDVPVREREISGQVAGKIAEDAGAIVAQLSRRLEAELKALADDAELMIT